MNKHSAMQKHIIWILKWIINTTKYVNIMICVWVSGLRKFTVSTILLFIMMMNDLLDNKEHPKGHAGPKAEH